MKSPCDWLGALVALVALSAGLGVSPARAANVVALGDSLTAEYQAIPDLAGFPVEATSYADVTVDGWESMSWVEVLAALRPVDFNFGRERPFASPWPPPRFAGFALNWGVPGVEADRYEEFVTATASSNALYFGLRLPLDNQLRNTADRVVIWLGTNEFRANYGAIYDGGSSTELIDNLIEDLSHVIDYVQNRNPALQIVIVNIPDIGATPSRKVAHPDPAKRALVTAAIAAANTRIAELAEAKGIAVADAAVHTANLIAGTPVFFGAVQMVDDQSEDNDPHYLFTRDGLHPNTALQILISRSIIKAFNSKYAAGIRPITDAEALSLLDINPREPYMQWIEQFDVSAKGPLKDGEGDGLTNVVEYTFAMDPSASDAASLPATRGGPVAGVTGDVSVTYSPDPARARHIEVIPQYSLTGTSWKRVPADHLIDNGDGSFTAVVPPQSGATVLTRLKVSLLPPSGSHVTILSVVPVE